MAVEMSHSPGPLAALAPNQGLGGTCSPSPPGSRAQGVHPKARREAVSAGAAATCGRSPSCDPPSLGSVPVTLCPLHSSLIPLGPMAARPAHSTCPGGSGSSFRGHVRLTSMPVSSPCIQNVSVPQGRAYKIADNSKWTRELTELCVCICVHLCQKQRKAETEKTVTEKRERQRATEAVGIPEQRNCFRLSCFVFNGFTVCLFIIGKGPMFKVNLPDGEPWAPPKPELQAVVIPSQPPPEETLRGSKARALCLWERCLWPHIAR